jgi:hypothetical protein
MDLSAVPYAGSPATIDHLVGHGMATAVISTIVQYTVASKPIRVLKFKVY